MKRCKTGPFWGRFAGTYGSGAIVSCQALSFDSMMAQHEYFGKVGVAYIGSQDVVPGHCLAAVFHFLPQQYFCGNLVCNVAAYKMCRTVYPLSAEWFTCLSCCLECIAAALQRVFGFIRRTGYDTVRVAS